jgi:hypothetical protein
VSTPTQQVLNLLTETALRLSESGDRLSETELERLEFARRRLKRVAVRSRQAARETVGVTGPQVHEFVEVAAREARAALKGEPWAVNCCLTGIDGVQYQARTSHAGVSISVQSKSLDGLLDGIGSVDLSSLDLEDVAA